HNPMEPFAATAVWEGDDRITVFDKTQGPQNCRNYVAGVFGMPRDKVRVLSPYVGGGFGSGLRPQYELPLAVLAARALKRSVPARRAAGGPPKGLGGVAPPPPADVHARLSCRERARTGARSQWQRQPRLVPARRREHDLAIRGFPAGFGQLVEPALRMRKQRARSKARQARSKYPLRHACAGRSGRRLCHRMRDG